VEQETKQQREEPLDKGIKFGFNHTQQKEQPATNIATTATNLSSMSSQQ